MVASRRAWVFVALAVFLASTTTWVVVSALFAHAAQAPSVHGARLGLTVSEFRRQFSPGVPGVFHAATSASGNGDLALEWVAEPAPSGTASAPLRLRVEFHAGALVALRVTLPTSSPLAVGSGLTYTSDWVLLRRADQDHAVSLTILSRRCPTHAAEVRALLEGRSF